MGYFEMWYADKMSMVKTMEENVRNDLECGYNPDGYLIIKQYEAINNYEEDIREALEDFKHMDEKAIERWCKFDLLERGVIDGGF